MASYTYVVTQVVHYYEPVDFGDPQEVIEWIEEGGEWDTSKNEVKSDRVQVYDDQGVLVADSNPDTPEEGS